MELLVGAAVEVVPGDDLFADLRYRKQGQRLRRVPGRDGERAGPALDGGDSSLEDVVRRVHDAAVDVAELFEGEEVRGVLRVAEDVGGRLVDGHGPGAGGRVRVFLAGVNRHVCPVCILLPSYGSPSAGNLRLSVYQFGRPV